MDVAADVSGNPPAKPPASSAAVIGPTGRSFLLSFEGFSPEALAWIHEEIPVIDNSRKSSSHSRVPKACQFCRRRKQRCEDKRPCKRCVQKKIACIEHEDDYPGTGSQSFKRQRTDVNDDGESDSGNEAENLTPPSFGGSLAAGVPRRSSKPGSTIHKPTAVRAASLANSVHGPSSTPALGSHTAMLSPASSFLDYGHPPATTGSHHPALASPLLYMSGYQPPAAAMLLPPYQQLPSMASFPTGPLGFPSLRAPESRTFGSAPTAFGSPLFSPAFGSRPDNTDARGRSGANEQNITSPRMSTVPASSSTECPPSGSVSPPLPALRTGSLPSHGFSLSVPDVSSSDHRGSGLVPSEPAEFEPTTSKSVPAFRALMLGPVEPGTLLTLPPPISAPRLAAGDVPHGRLTPPSTVPSPDVLRGPRFANLAPAGGLSIDFLLPFWRNDSTHTDPQQPGAHTTVFRTLSQCWAVFDRRCRLDSQALTELDEAKQIWSDVMDALTKGDSSRVEQILDWASSRTGSERFQVAIGFLCWTADGKIRHSNWQLSLMLGFSPADIRSMYDRALIHPEDRDKLIQSQSSVRDPQNMVFYMPVRLATSSQHVVPMSCAVSTLRDPLGRSLLTVALLTAEER
eukprot:TRINITY_DN762_c0_g1_i3.p1 TRINITY_DN762_c0_g1~~TRINITY_DN762_c0_g1_i3.p1  ORF type:complete len:628 (+),score=62.68 TRINITY_DN762_c0_g1_i3:62-1945(+)